MGRDINDISYTIKKNTNNYAWRLNCRDGSAYGIDPEYYKTREEYHDALDRAIAGEKVERPTKKYLPENIENTIGSSFDEPIVASSKPVTNGPTNNVGTSIDVSVDYRLAPPVLEMEENVDPAEIAELRNTFTMIINSMKEGKSLDDFETLLDAVLKPMFDKDIRVAAELWYNALVATKDTFGQVSYSGYGKIADRIFYEVPWEKLGAALVLKPGIGVCIFEDGVDAYRDYANDFLRTLVCYGEVDLANKMLEHLSKNHHSSKPAEELLYDALNKIFTSMYSKWLVSPENLQALERWTNCFLDAGLKAKARVKYNELMRCVKGEALRGNVPIDILNQVGGWTRLMNAGDDNTPSGEPNPHIEGTRIADLLSGNYSKPKANANAQPSSVARTTNTSQNRNFSQTTRQAQAQKSGPSKNVQPATKSRTIDEAALAESLQQLDRLTGLDTVKSDVRKMINLARVSIMRRDHDIKTPDISLHLVFSGNPGTGKTTVARILGDIYHAMGVLSKGHFVEASRQDLVAEYVGHTAPKTQQVIDSAMGGILFIDEAYSLAKPSGGSTGADYGTEAIEVLLKQMEDHRDDFMVIVAGYKNEMQRFIDANPGLKSRFNKYIHFEDYDEESLYKIFVSVLIENQLSITYTGAHVVKEYIHDLVENKDQNFGNARDIRNLVDKIITEQATRIIEEKVDNMREVQIITEEDVERAVRG